MNFSSTLFAYISEVILSPFGLFNHVEYVPFNAGAGKNYTGLGRICPEMQNKLKSVIFMQASLNSSPQNF